MFTDVQLMSDHVAQYVKNVRVLALDEVGIVELEVFEGQASCLVLAIRTLREKQMRHDGKQSGDCPFNPAEAATDEGQP